MRKFTIALLGAATLAGSAPVRAEPFWHWVRQKPAAPRTQTWRASFYGGGEYLHRRPASGEIFHPNAMTAAHRTLPFGTRLRIRFRGRSVIVRINDRGPAAWTGRSLDLSSGAARTLGLMGAGVGPVAVSRLN